MDNSAIYKKYAKQQENYTKTIPSASYINYKCNFSQNYTLIHTFNHQDLYSLGPRIHTCNFKADQLTNIYGMMSNQTFLSFS